MAIQKLNTIGITKTKPGQGTYVINFNLEEYMGQVSELLWTPELIDHVLEFRRIIELTSLELAVNRATKEDLEKLNKLTKRHVELGKKIVKNENVLDNVLFEKYAGQDLKIHNLIVQMSYNPVIQSAYAIVKDTIYEYIKFILSKKLSDKSYNLVVDNDPHRVIYNAILNNNYEEAKQAYIEMIDYNLENRDIIQE